MDEYVATLAAADGPLTCSADCARFTKQHKACERRVGCNLVDSNSAEAHAGKVCEAKPEIETNKPCPRDKLD